MLVHLQQEAVEEGAVCHPLEPFQDPLHQQLRTQPTVNLWYWSLAKKVVGPRKTGPTPMYGWEIGQASM